MSLVAVVAAEEVDRAARHVGDGVGELLVFCPECWQWESGAGTLADCR